MIKIATAICTIPITLIQAAAVTIVVTKLPVILNRLYRTKNVPIIRLATTPKSNHTSNPIGAYYNLL